MSDAGYARMHRSLLGHPAFRNEGETMAFAWMIMRASWKPARVRYKGIPITLERGQLAISIRDFAVSHDRPKGWVERLFARLKNETMIETRSETGVTIITICKYDHYQAEQDTRKTSSETAKKTATGQRQDTEQEREEGKKEEPLAKASGTRASALPADFEPILTDGASKIVSGWPPGMVDRELTQFKDDAIAKGKTFKDWQAAFRTWISNAEKWRHKNGRNGQSASGYGVTIDAALGFIADGELQRFGPS